jgi:hypothetical protein
LVCVFFVFLICFVGFWILHCFCFDLLFQLETKKLVLMLC